MKSFDNSIDAPKESQKSSISSQNQKVDVSEANTVSLVFKPDHDYIIAISVFGFVVLVIVAAIIVSVLYQQGILTDTDYAVFDDEVRKQLERGEQDRIRKQNETQRMQRLTEMVLDRAKHQFKARLGIFIAGIVISLIVVMIGLAVDSLEVLFSVEIVASFILFSLNQPLGGGYMIAVINFTCLSIAAAWFLYLKLKGSKSPLFNQLIGIFVLLAIASIVGPIIDMIITGLNLWG